MLFPSKAPPTPPPIAAPSNQDGRDAYEDFWALLESDFVRNCTEAAQDSADPGPGSAYQQFLDC